MHTKADFAFELPPAQIAQAPAPTRDGSRLLVVGEPLLDARFPALIDHLPPDPVVIVNDARVVPARVHGHRPSGGAAEVLFVEPADADAAVPPGHVGWRCLVRAGGKLHPGDPIAADRDPAVALTVASERGDGGAVTIAVPGCSRSSMAEMSAMRRLRLSSSPFESTAPARSTSVSKMTPKSAWLSSTASRMLSIASGSSGFGTWLGKRPSGSR